MNALPEKENLVAAQAVLDGLLQRRHDIKAKLEQAAQAAQQHRMAVAEAVMSGGDVPRAPAPADVESVNIALSVLDGQIRDAEFAVVVAKGKHRAATLKIASGVRQQYVDQANAALRLVEVALAKAYAADMLLSPALQPTLSPYVLSTGFRIPLVSIADRDTDGSGNACDACRIRDVIGPRVQGDVRRAVLDAIGEETFPWV